MPGLFTDETLFGAMPSGLLAPKSVTADTLADGAVTSRALDGELSTTGAGVQIRQGSAVITTDASGIGTVAYDTPFPSSTDNVVCVESQGGDFLACPRDPGSGTWLAASFDVVVRVASTGALSAGAKRINYVAFGT